MNITFIRHGESLGNVDHKVYYDMPDWKVPLTKNGEEQARKIGKTLNGEYFDFDAIIHSPYVRAVETAKIINEELSPKLTMIENPLCREREWGSLRDEIESVETKEQKEELFDFFRRPQGGESFADLYQRAIIFFNDIDKMGYTNIIVVSHGEFIKICHMILCNINVEGFYRIPDIKNCEAHLFHDVDKRYGHF